jgi:hypothetical protein
VKLAHTHPEHPNVIAFKQANRWYELPRAEFNRLVRVGRDIERDEEREARQRQREEARAARAQETEQKREARIQRQDERYREMQRRQIRAMDRAERAEVVKIIKSSGGIRLPEHFTYTGKSREGKGEYDLLPSDVRRKNGHYTMDTAAAAINEEMPWLHIESPGDLLQYFERSRLKTIRERYNAKARRAFEAA